MRPEHEEHEEDRTAINIATAILLLTCIVTAIIMATAPEKPQPLPVYHFTEAAK